MSTQQNTVSTVQTLDRIKMLIENEQGDRGRLRYIYEFIQRGKSLYRSDQQYIEKKINASIIFEKPKPPSIQEEQKRSIQMLLEQKIGFPERLRFMLNWIRKGKDLFNCDKEYLDDKLKQIPPKFKKHRTRGLKFILPHKIPEIQELPPLEMPSSKQIPSNTIEKLKSNNQKIIQLEKELIESKNKIFILEATLVQKNKEIEKKDTEIQKLTSKFEKMVSDTSLENLELDELKQKILDETQKIDKQKIISEQIKKQKEKLEQLISYREEYEKRVTKEREILEKKIKIENQKIAEKDLIVEDLTKKQEQLEQNRIERETILEQVKKEQTRLEREIKKQKNELEKVNEEYGDIFDELSKNEKNDTDSKS